MRHRSKGGWRVEKTLWVVGGPRPLTECCGRVVTDVYVGEGAVAATPKATSSYTELRVKDMDESIRFCVDLLGMENVGERESVEPSRGNSASSL